MLATSASSAASSLQAGHPDTLDDLARLHRPLLLRVIRRHLGRRLAGLINPEDIFHDMWLRAGPALRAAMATDASLDPRAWLCHAARWQAYQANRDHLTRSKRQRQRQVSLAGDGCAALDREASPALQASAHEEYDRALQGDYGTRILVAVLSLEGYTRDDIAHRLGISLSTLRRREIEEEERGGGTFSH